MLEIPELGGLRSLPWTALRPGQVYIDGVRINDTVPPELRGFPVVTWGLLSVLRERYRFLPGRTVVVAEGRSGCDPGALSGSIRRAAEGLDRLNRLREEHFRARRRVLESLGLDPSLEIPLIRTDGVEQDQLVLDACNSFIAPIPVVAVVGPGPPAAAGDGLEIPSLFHRAGLKMTLTDLLTGRLSGTFRLPSDGPVVLHLVVDYSMSMDSGGKIDLVASALNGFYSYLAEVLLNTRIRLYVFSDTCRLVDYPLSGRELGRGETSYASFMKKVLHHRDPDVHNKVILFTDGMPSDCREALRLAELLRRNRVDYTQIVFRLGDELRYEVRGKMGPEEAVDGYTELREGLESVALSDEELEAKLRSIRGGFTEVARRCGGNQVILRINEILNLVAVECYDRYLGLLSLAGAAV